MLVWSPQAVFAWRQTGCRSRVRSAPMRHVLEVFGKICLCIVIATGCQPEIGDSCNVSDDCSQQGDRLCDTTQPGGYCTQFNCEPGSCPDEAICVAFTRASLEHLACNTGSSGLAGRRTFCLRSCRKQSDCRKGYECGDVGERGNPWGATLVETRSVRPRVCVVPVETVPTEGAEDAVCFGNDEPTGVGAASGVAGASPAVDSGGMAGDSTQAGSSSSGAGGGN